MSPAFLHRLPLALLLATLAACAGSRPVPLTQQMGPEAAKARARADSLRYPYTVADIEFMQGMIHHHAQAIKISRWAASHGASGAVKVLTGRIITSQSDDIALMRQWLEDRNQPAARVDADGNVAMDHSQHGAHDVHMPGMLTEEQLAQLDAARGEEFDYLFLTFMIQHHRGAIDMVRKLFSAHGAGQDETIFKFATEVEVDQSTEIKRMLQMLIEA